MSEVGANCRSGCRTRDHATFGECARSADIQIDRHGLQGHRTAERMKERRLGEYESLRNQGIQPKSTQWSGIREAQESGGVAKTEVNPNAQLPAGN